MFAMITFEENFGIFLHHYLEIHTFMSNKETNISEIEKSTKKLI